MCFDAVTSLASSCCCAGCGRPGADAFVELPLHLLVVVVVVVVVDDEDDDNPYDPVQYDVQDRT